MELSSQQRLYLQAVFDHFHQHGVWPTYRELERHFYALQIGLNIEEVSKNLPAGLSNIFTPIGDAMLTVPAIHVCRGSESDLRDFIWMIRFCVEQYLASNDPVPNFSSEDLLKRLFMPASSIRKIGALIQIEPGIYENFIAAPATNGWYFTISRDVLRFQGVTTIEQYLTKRALPDDVSVSPVGEQKNPAVERVEELQLHPAIRSYCWDLYTVGNYDNAVLNATKLLEIQVRDRAHLPLTMVGVDVMNQAFRGRNPPLHYGQVDAEQEGLAELLRGMIRIFKNPQSHRIVGMQNKTECLSVLLLCSTLLYIVDNVEYRGGTPSP